MKKCIFNTTVMEQEDSAIINAESLSLCKKWPNKKTI
jgi:hypothetical protein